MTTEAPSIHRPLRAIHLLLAVAVFCGLFALSYPYYCYFVDPDAVAYLTMAKRAAGGEPWRLVNALWSPLHPALVAACIQCGMDALLAAQLTNAAACMLVLFASFALFRRFKIPHSIGVPLLLALSVFLTYALYKQLFCDLWQVGLLLAYLWLLTSQQFLRKPLYWLLCGLTMALATYAKVYSFYFLLLHFPLAILLLNRAVPAGDATSFPITAAHPGLVSGSPLRPGPRAAFALRAYATTFIFQVLLLLPLALLMHHKYGFLGLSRSGALNTSWTLTGHKSLRPGIGALIPPPYPNSPYTWEDPYLSEGALHSRFESMTIMKRQVGHSILAALQGVEAANQISPLLPAIFFASALAVWQKKSAGRCLSGHKILLLAAAIMPLGYLLLHFEARYLWLLLPVGMILGAFSVERLRPFLTQRKAFPLACWLFALSFTAYPLYDMKALFRKGEDTYRLAAALINCGIRGSFTSNDHPSRSGCLAYWLGCNYYTPAGEAMNAPGLLADMRRYKVQFYFHYQHSLDVTNVWMQDEKGRPFQRVDGDRIKGLQVFLINP